MRYDTPVFFQKISGREYDENTGDYSDGNVEETRKFANVHNTYVETMQLIYGGIKKGSYTVHLQNHYVKPFDFIRIGDKRCEVSYRRKLRTKDIYIVLEV